MFLPFPQDQLPVSPRAMFLLRGQKKYGKENPLRGKGLEKPPFPPKYPQSRKLRRRFCVSPTVFCAASEVVRQSGSGTALRGRPLRERDIFTRNLRRCAQSLPLTREVAERSEVGGRDKLRKKNDYPSVAFGDSSPDKGSQGVRRGRQSPPVALRHPPFTQGGL